MPPTNSHKLLLVHSPSVTMLDTVSYPAAATSHSLRFFIIIIIIINFTRGVPETYRITNVKLYKYLYTVYECTDESSIG